MSRMKVLVTNDDGIDSIGLHHLARSVSELGEVCVVAPDTEYSGAGAAIGPLHLKKPEIHVCQIDGVEKSFSVNGPPGLCVYLARLGVFGWVPDLVVAGINPGANVGRSVYHSGTIGACLTARSGGISGVAISQEITGFGIDGQGWDAALVHQRWETAAEVAKVIVREVLADLPRPAAVLNINVPNVSIEEVVGWRYTELGALPPRTIKRAWLEPRPGHDGAFEAAMEWGDAVHLPEDSDGGAVEAGYVSLTWLGAIGSEARPSPALEAVLNGQFGPTVEV